MGEDRFKSLCKSLGLRTTVSFRKRWRGRFAGLGNMQIYLIILYIIFEHRERWQQSEWFPKVFWNCRNLEVFITSVGGFMSLVFLDLSLKMMKTISMPSKFSFTLAFADLIAPCPWVRNCSTRGPLRVHQIFQRHVNIFHLDAIGAWKLGSPWRTRTSNQRKPWFFLKTNMHI